MNAPHYSADDRHIYIDNPIELSPPQYNDGAALVIATVGRKCGKGTMRHLAHCANEAPKLRAERDALRAALRATVGQLSHGVKIDGNTDAVLQMARAALAQGSET